VMFERHEARLESIQTGSGRTQGVAGRRRGGRPAPLPGRQFPLRF
jgi:hypothetical protein